LRQVNEKLARAICHIWRTGTWQKLAIVDARAKPQIASAIANPSDKDIIACQDINVK
jgi:hypothetical protein